MTIHHIEDDGMVHLTIRLSYPIDVIEAADDIVEMMTEDARRAIQRGCDEIVASTP